MRFIHVMLCICLFALDAQAAQAEDPAVGDIFRNDSTKAFRGWKLAVSGIRDDNIGYQTFSKNNREILAVTKPLVRTARGGYEVEEILHVREIFQMSGEERMFDCPFLSLSPAVVFLNEKSKIARGYFVFAGGIEVKRWLIDDLTDCDPGGD